MKFKIHHNASRFHLRNEVAAFAEGYQNGELVLDAGAGRAPYRSLFARAKYETADFQKVDKKYDPVTYVCDLADIPVENDRFDCIVFNQVLEHLPYPAKVLNEFSRILKKDGLVFCSCPFFFEEHEQPYDFFRYTQFGLTKLFSDAGFEIVEIRWLEGYLGTLAYQMWRATKHINILPRNGKKSIFSRNIITNFWGVLAIPFLAVIALSSMIGAFVLSRLDRVLTLKDRGYPINYVVIARKK